LLGKCLFCLNTCPAGKAILLKGGLCASGAFKSSRPDQKKDPKGIWIPSAFFSFTHACGHPSGNSRQGADPWRKTLCPLHIQSAIVSSTHHEVGSAPVVF